MDRRTLLAGAATALGTAAWADAPLTSLRPIARAAEGHRPRIDTAAMIAEAGLSGTVGFVLADAATGEIIEDIAGDQPQPPASVAKAVTALYAIETLTPAHRFRTRILAVGDVRDGILDGDLILAGGGDPNLLTDDLDALAQSLRDTGLTGVTGRFLVWDNALVNLDAIDSTQLEHLGYNPTITGLNLNFNRVHFEWKRKGNAFDVAMDARSETLRPPVKMARMQIVDRVGPVFTYRDGNGVDEWTVARRALNNAGSRWLPVRYPALYAGEVFAQLAAGRGIALKPPVEIAEVPQAARIIAHHDSAPLTAMMQDMLQYSTNLTAEAAGLAATERRSGQMRGLRTSALGMARWAEERAGVSATFVDHSGLGDASRLTAGDMVRLLTAEGVRATLHPIMKAFAVQGDQERQTPTLASAVRAKTGTLNFVSSLAGYLRTADGCDLAFAFFAADLEARERGKALGDEQPAGSISWNTAAKGLQKRLLLRWVVDGDVELASR